MEFPDLSPVPPRPSKTLKGVGLRPRRSVSASHTGAAHIAFDRGDGLGLRGFKTFAAHYPTPLNHCVRFVAVVADGLTQHSLPGGRYPLPVPDFHRLNQISFSWRTPSD